MKLARKIKLYVGRYLNEHSVSEADKRVDLYMFYALEDYELDVNASYVLFYKSSKKLKRYRSFAKMLNIDVDIIDNNMQRIVNSYKTYLTKYHYYLE